MHFIKMHGLGNNYVLFNLLDASTEHLDFSRLSQKVSDVRFGIGSDGIILICPSERADFKMRIFNADGSEGKNCGNGLRCVAKYLFDHRLAVKPRFTIETLGGDVVVEVDAVNHQQVRQVTVDMGEPRLLRSMIPMKGDPYSTAINEPYAVDGNIYHLTSVSMGNPHTIFFVDHVAQVPLEKLGPLIEHDDLFPERVNVSVVHVRNERELDYRVWERGSGLTMACGTGACAAVVAATLNGYINKDERVTVHLPGGDLTIRWDENGHVWKTGEASYICYGELDLSPYALNTV